jgi:hypothetical protein
MPPEPARDADREVGSRPYRIARLLLWVLGPATVLLVGTSLYVQSSGFRARVLVGIERELAGSMRGQISLSGLTDLGLSGARLDRLELKDEHGEVVLALEGIHVRFDPFELLAPLLPGAHAGLTIEHVRVERSRVLLIQDARSDEPSLVRAFGNDRPPGSPGTPPDVYAFPSVEIGEVLGARRSQRSVPPRFARPRMISMIATASSMPSPRRGGITHLKRMMPLPTSRIVRVCPTPHAAPISAALRTFRWPATIVVTATT